MTHAAIDLGATITGLRPFVPCDDYELCKRFYSDLGFAKTYDSSLMAIFVAGDFSFVLQNYRWETARDNYVLQLVVDDVDAWRSRADEADLAGKYGVRVTEVKQEPWGAKGARVFHLFDPTGVLWHISQYER